MRRRVTLALLLLPISALATTFTVKAGGGGNFTTINACTTQMSASGGDTCTVFAGTYTENPSINAGLASSYNVLTVNGSDVVTVNGQITVNSHTKAVGNCPALQGTQTSATCGFFVQNASSPTTNCFTVAANATDWFIQGNNGYDCGGLSSPSTASFGSVLGNTFSYPCSTSASPNVCTPLKIFGNHIIVENNDLSHFSDGSDGGGDHNVFRGNSFHNAHTSDISTNGDNHVDMIELSGNGATLFLFEGNQFPNCFVDGGVGAACHGGPLAQCGVGPCGPTILRFQVDYHIQGAATTADQGNWPNLKEYNNTWADMQNGGTGGFQTNNQTGEQSGANLNEIYYYVTNPTPSNQGHPYGYGASPGSSRFGNDLAWCPNEPSGTCSANLFGFNTGAFSADPNNKIADPLFNSFASQDFHLQSGSPALNAGTNLTTVAAGDSGSGTSLVVNDANYFQDAWGFPAGTGLGQMEPDCISVTSVLNHICIAAGGINYATNTLTLASSITRSPGDPVWLYSDSLGAVRLTGTAPNMGALGTAASGAAASLAQGGNANQNNYPGGGGVASTVALYGQTYTPFAGKLLWTCSWSNGSPTITCPTGTFTAAVQGYDAFATNLLPSGGTGFASSVFTCGSAGTRTTIQTVTDSAHVNLSANCTANSGASNPFFFGPDETPGLQSLATALNNGCGAGIIPQGWALIKSATFVDPPQTACVNPIGGSRQGPDLTGYGPGESQFVIAPDFNWASCQTHGATGHTCFFGAAPGGNSGGYAVRYLGINGLGGQYTISALTVLTEFDANTYADHVNIVGVGGRTANLIGVKASAYPTDLNFMQVDSAGTIACQLGSSVGAITIEHSYCGDTNCLTTNGGSLDISGYLNSTQNIYGPCWTNSTYEVNQAAGAQTFTSDQDEYIDNSGGTSVVFLGNNGTGTMRVHAAKILPTATSDIGIFIGTSGATVALDHSTVKTTGTTSKAVVTVAGTTLDDSGCGNSYTTVSANTVFGVVNCASEPSFGGRCLLASAAGPLACGFSSNGKVAVPVTTTTYTINTTAVASGSTILVTPTTDNTGIPGAPACGAEVFGDGAITASVASTSFTFAQTSAAVIKCYNWSIR